MKAAPTGERMMRLKKREMEFCRLAAVLGNPEQAARRAGYKHPDEAWPALIMRQDIADEIRRAAREVSRVYRDTLLCCVYRLMSADNTDALRLVYHDDMSDREIREMNLSGVAEIKRTKDKSVEIKFFDRIKALDKFAELSDASADGASSGGLLEAMRLSAQALSRMHADEVGDDAG